MPSLVCSEMIEPSQWGPNLVADIESGSTPPGSIDIWRLGQSGVVCRFPSSTVLFDLYLSNHIEAVFADPLDHRRLTRSPLDPAEITFGDVVVCSHDHLDHLDIPTMRTLGRQLPAAVAVAPKSAAGTLEALGWRPGRLRRTLDGEMYREKALTITAFAVAHEDFDERPDTGHPYQGYAVSDGRVTVAHLGDSVDTLRTRAALRELQPDVLLVPINGRSPERKRLGFAGNTTAEEAVELAIAVGKPWLVPLHYDMFAMNVDDDALGRFISAATEAELGFVTLHVGERWRFSGRDVANSVAL